MYAPKNIDKAISEDTLSYKLYCSIICFMYEQCEITEVKVQTTCIKATPIANKIRVKV